MFRDREDPERARRAGARREPARHQPAGYGAGGPAYCHHDHYWPVYFDTNDAITRVAQDAGWPAPTLASVTA